MGEYAGNSVRKWWDWGWGWILTRKPTSLTCLCPLSLVCAPRPSSRLSLLPVPLVFLLHLTPSPPSVSPSPHRYRLPLPRSVVPPPPNRFPTDYPLCFSISPTASPLFLSASPIVSPSSLPYISPCSHRLNPMLSASPPSPSYALRVPTVSPSPTQIPSTAMHLRGLTFSRSDLGTHSLSTRFLLFICLFQVFLSGISRSASFDDIECFLSGCQCDSRINYMYKCC